MSQKSDSVVVIGGGIVGAMCAWELSGAGCDVTIVDQGKFGAACSHGNCGYISPSHVLPLAQPGTILKTTKLMFKSNSAFAVKPRFDTEALRWFWKFARRCNRNDMLSAAQGLHPLLQSSKRLYQELIAREGIDCEWQERGILFVFESEKEFNEYAHTDQLIQENFGVEAKAYPTDELVKLEPAIKPVVAGAWFYPGDCHMRPDKLLTALRAKLEERGVTVLEDTSIQGFRRENGQARAATTSSGASVAELPGDQFVVATGAWAPFLNHQLGCRLPIQPGKGYSLTMPTPARMPKIPIIFEDTHVAITPMESKYRIGSTMEFVGYDTSINARRLALLRDSAERYLHDPMCEPIEEEWYGWRPMTPDSKPIIDRSPAFQNVWICAGHSMLGLSAATGSARLAREMMLGETPHIDPGHFSVNRK